MTAEWRKFREHCPFADKQDERIFGATLRQFGEKITAMALDRAANWGSREVTATRIRAIASDLVREGYAKQPLRERPAGKQARGPSRRTPAGLSPAQQEAGSALENFGVKNRLAERSVRDCGIDSGDEASEEMIAAAFRQVERLKREGV